MTVWIWVWLGVLAVSLIVEFLTMELVSVWISVGSLISLILAMCKVGYEIQIIVCVVVSVVCILLLRKVALKLLNKDKQKTNIDSVVGMQVKLLSDITEDKMGTVKVNDIVWNAKSETNEEIQKDNFVEIVRIEGNKFIVRRRD